MALGHSPRIITDGLVLALDAANRKSYIGAVTTSLINTDSWTVSSGTVSGYNCNGATNENVRSYDTDPWGNQSLVWGTFADGSGGADGGWNTDYPGIDPTKLYRFSVWVRRTSSTGAGTFYFGTGAGGAEVMGTSDSATKGNPYWECTGTGNLTQNQWYLCCGHVYPHFTTYTGRHPNTGYFTVAGGTTKVMDVNGCNIGSDLKWNPASSSAVHRTYHYYCGDATTRLQFLSPRMDVCDGREPSILELLTNGVSTWRDISGMNNHGVLMSGVTYSQKTFNFNGSTTYIKCSNAGLTHNTNNFTYSCWANWSSLPGLGTLFENGLYTNGILIRFETNLIHIYAQYATTSFNGTMVFTPTVGIWYNLVLTRVGNILYLYSNGVQIASLAFGTSINIIPSTGFLYVGMSQHSSGQCFNGQISNASIYSRDLSEAEVKQNFNAIRGRYGV